METEQERYYRRKNRNMDAWDDLSMAFGEGCFFFGFPYMMIISGLFLLSVFIDLPFIAWVGIAATIMAVVMGCWSVPASKKGLLG